MSYTKSLFFAIIVAGTFQMCKEDVSVEPGKVKFTFVPSEVSDRSGRITEEDHAAIQVSIENSNGESILANHRIDLLRAGNGYISESVELLPGNYSLTDFFIVDHTGETAYITPKSGAPLAKVIQHPLPIDFSVSNHEVSNLSVEVVSVTGHNPEEFGYIMFDIDTVDIPGFSLEVLSARDQSEINDTEVHILKNRDTLHSFMINSLQNTISFIENPEESFRLVVGKEGYKPFIQEFTYNQLKEELQNDPLAVALEPAFTMVTSAGEFQISLSGNENGQITVHWGDGSEETFTLGDNTDLNHSYSQAGSYFISITGALDKITDFYSFYGAGPIDKINFNELPELSDLRLGLTRSPKVIDLSNNRKLTSINMPGCEQLEALYIAEDNQILSLNIEGPNNISTEAIDNIIYKLHKSVILTNRTGGTLGLSLHWGNAESMEMIGPPSPEAMTRVTELKNNYNWFILPDISSTL